jgi:N-acetylglucosaminyldiphosphoundecaprenol N-acetyl-beta-D-mannosaminyltransferase
MRAYKDQFNVPFLMGVGGSVDVIAGYVNRAPEWMQKYGLEWFYRMKQEPRRLFMRYATTNSRYAGLLLAGMVMRVFIS